MTPLRERPGIGGAGATDAELTRCHATLRALAARVHRARSHRADGLAPADPAELRALSRQIRQLRELFRDRDGGDLRRWLENLQAEVDALVLTAPAASRAVTPLPDVDMTPSAVVAC